MTSNLPVTVSTVAASVSELPSSVTVPLSESGLPGVTLMSAGSLAPTMVITTSCEAEPSSDVTVIVRVKVSPSLSDCTSMWLLFSV